MNKEEFIFQKFKDNVIKIKVFKEYLDKHYQVIGDNAVRLINRIFDYQRLKYGIILDSGMYVGLTFEDKKRLSDAARQRKYNRKRR